MKLPKTHLRKNVAEWLQHSIMIKKKKSQQTRKGGELPQLKKNYLQKTYN